jgi:hypothetical protein
MARDLRKKIRPVIARVVFMILEGCPPVAEFTAGDLCAIMTHRVEMM